jgi:cellulose synthase/poly-beta-1,6-N-acetylglucosamine synthase-like glycosyltransferase
VIFVFYIFAPVLVYFSYKSFRGGIDYLNYFKRELAKPRSETTPFATIFAPCRGVDQGMLENLDALLSQDYPEYEVVFIVDEETDGATNVIEAAWREARRQVKLVVAPKATDSSQKVTNLREGIEYADENSEVFVFVDSDARPSRGWLRSLVAPLEDEKIGAATGYRWFISKRETVASEMRSMWNASIASALGANRSSNFCWGGSTAIRRETFERLNIRERWRGTVSDDFTLTHATQKAGLDIYFVPQALTASVEDCTVRELFEFTTRQMKITRVYASKLWSLSFFGAGLFTAVMLTAFAIMIFSKKNDWPVVAAMLTILLVTVFSIGKSWYRMRAVRLVLPQHAAKLRRQMLPQLTLWSLTPALFLYNCVAAWISRSIDWRGTTYDMISPTETVIVEQPASKK